VEGCGGNPARASDSPEKLQMNRMPSAPCEMTKMLHGYQERTIDEKGRIIIPSKLREVLTGKIFVTYGLEQCIFLFPVDEWTRFCQTIRDYPFFMGEEVRDVQRWFIGGAVECTIDTQGRVLLPENLLKYANIDKEVVILGLINRVEIWAKEVWMERFKNIGQRIEKSTRSLFENAKGDGGEQVRDE